MPVLRNIGQLASCPPSDDQSDIGLIANAALVWRGNRIVWLGPESDLPEEYQAEEAENCRGRLIVPGLIDCHTHLCFGGWREQEFEQRIQGKSYLEIAEAGGGIINTVRATRDADSAELSRKAAATLDDMLALGITTVEAKSGYGLDFDNEIKQLEIYARLNRTHDIDLVATLLGAHVIPPEYRDNRREYISLLTERLIPAVADRELAEFCDCYIDAGAFTLEEGREILECAKQCGLGLKIHAEQIQHTGAAGLAADLGAVSAEHLEHIDDRGIQAMAGAGTVAVTLPLASLYLREAFTDAGRLIKAGIPVAVATDFNPGSAPSYHLPFAMTLACLNQQMTPAETLKGVTSYAARAIGRQHLMGSLLPGYQADISVIDAPSVNHWLYQLQGNACHKVIKAGQQIN